MRDTRLRNRSNFNNPDPTIYSLSHPVNHFSASAPSPFTVFTPPISSPSSPSHQQQPYNMPAPVRKRGANSSNAASPGNLPKRHKAEPDQQQQQQQQQQHQNSPHQTHVIHGQAQHAPPQFNSMHPQSPYHNPPQHPSSTNVYGDPAQGLPNGTSMPIDSPSVVRSYSQYGHSAVNSYPSSNYSNQQTQQTNGMATPNMNGQMHSPYSQPINAQPAPPPPPPAPPVTPQTTKAASAASSAKQPDTTLPPNPRIRTDGKGRDPYNIDTICKQLGISTAVWDQKLRLILNDVINLHGLNGQKVIPTNLAAREAAVDDWITRCPEWLNEPNEAYRRVYAMDRLKCGMADIRRVENQRKKKKEGGLRNGTNGASEDAEGEKAEDVGSPDTNQRASTAQPHDSPALIMPPAQISTPLPVFNERPLPGTGGGVPAHMNNFVNPSPPSQQAVPAPVVTPGSSTMSQPPYPPAYNGASPEIIIVTVVESMGDRRCTLTANDFLPNGEYNYQNIVVVLREDLGFNPVTQRIYYEGPYGRVYVHNDRSLRNAISIESARGNRYPKWEVER